MVDMRKRFRGNKPIAVSTELEAGGGRTDTREVPMLYAGKGTFDGVDAARQNKKDGDEYEIFVRNDGIEDLRKK